MEKRALTIGINRYPKYPGEGLRNSVRDARAWYDALRGRFGFPEGHMTLLLDEQADRAGILRALDDLAERAGPDDIVVITYSGHGTQIPDTTGDEPDAFDEALVPSDWDGEAGSPSLIRDDDLARPLARIQEKTPHLTLVFDCCSSGSLLRGSSDSRVRFAPPVESSAPPAAPPATPAFEAARPGRSGGLKGGARWGLDASRYVFLAACEDGEQALEADSHGYGAFTKCLLDEIGAAGPETSTLDVFRRASARVAKTSPGQHPIAEGALGREVFGARDLSPAPAASVLDAKGSVVYLDAGLFHGARVGSQWRVLDPHDTRVELAKIRLTHVSGATSRGKVSSGSAGKVKPGHPVTEILDSAAASEGDPLHARRAHLRALPAAQGPGKLPDGSVALQILLPGPETAWAPAPRDERGRIALEEGQRFAIEAKNGAPTRLYLALFWLDMAAGVWRDKTLTGSNQAVAPGAAFVAGADEGGFEMGIPEGIPVDPAEGGEEAFLLLASTKETDYGLLMARRDASPASVVGSLFRGAFHGARGEAPAPQGEPEQWAAALVSVYVRRRGGRVDAPNR